MIKKFIIFLVVYLSVNLSFASPVTALSKLYLLHINGLNTTQNKALLNVNQLQSTANTSSAMTVWNLVYNPTQTDSEWDWVASMKGYFDICVQKWFENNILPTLDEFTEQAMNAQNLDYPIGSPEFYQFESSLVTQFQDLVLDHGGKNMETVLDNFHNAVPAQYASVLNLLSNNGQTNYADSIDYVILLPHSQGNIYANNLYTYVTQTENFNSLHISIFGFASPAKTELGELFCNASTPNYVTSTNDGIIALAKSWTPGSVLPTNITIPKTETDTSGHGLIEIYLSDQNSIASMNSFLDITSHNCFTNLHQLESIGTLPEQQNWSYKFVYDKSSNNIMQLGGKSGKQICELSLNHLGSWVCEGSLNNSNIFDIWPNSLSTDGNGNIYMVGIDLYDWNTKYAITFKYLNGFTNTSKIEPNTQSSESDWMDAGYYNGSLYTLTDANTLIFSNQTQLNLLYGGAPYTIAPNGNLYVARGSQIYYQKLVDNATQYPFGNGISGIKDIMATNNKIYVCGVHGIYSLPLNAPSGSRWSLLPYDCIYLAGNDEDLFFSSVNGLVYHFAP